jgi:DNA primase
MIVFRLLFGLNYSYPYILQEDACIIVEGPMDVFAMWSYGIRNVAAILGTSIKFSQLCLLKRFAKKCYIMFDGDSIGRTQALASSSEFGTVGMTPVLVTLPKDFDPDDYLLNYGAENFRALLQQNEK